MDRTPLSRVLGAVLATVHGRHATRHAGMVAAATVLAASATIAVAPTRAHAQVTGATAGAAAIARTPSGNGYWIATTYGQVLSFGDAADHGAVTVRLNQPIVGMATTSDGGGYWLVAADGGIFPFGDAAGFGSTGGRHLNQPIVGMAAAPNNGGYWLVAADGGIFPFGDAGGFGSTGGAHLNQPIVGMATTSDGSGYWLVASDGGIFAFGDAHGVGSTGGAHLNQPITGIAATSDGRGYWLVARDGGIFPFGTARGYGSTGGTRLNAPIVGVASASGGAGYWLLAQDGGVFPFGPGAGGYGSAVGRIRTSSSVDVASRPECGVPQGAVTPGKVIVMSLTCQELTAYQDGVALYITDITTGQPALPTPPGQYSVLRKNSPWYMVSEYPPGSIGYYPSTWVSNVLWFRNDGYGIHDAPWRARYGPGTEQYGSHGCVNVPGGIMPSLYSWADVGTPVRIY